jgi:hypothetical protein
MLDVFCIIDLDHLAPMIRNDANSSRPHHYLNRLNLNELLTTVTDESAIAAAAKIGAWSLKNGIKGESIAMGIKITL